MKIRSFMKSHSIIATCFIFSAGLFFTGCDAGNPNLAQVTGKVTLDGKPLVEAELVFTPSDQTGGSSMASTDEEGNYTLFYSASETGAWIGDHSVTITKTDDREEGVFQLVPPKYNDQSTLTAAVVKGEDNVKNFDLESGDWDPKKSKQAQ
ncbi:MAG: carboxypeptidase-like regulatory domain-containing protein [Planctomycetota bacterium]